MFDPSELKKSVLCQLLLVCSHSMSVHSQNQNQLSGSADSRFLLMSLQESEKKRKQTAEDNEAEHTGFNIWRLREEELQRWNKD